MQKCSLLFDVFLIIVVPSTLVVGYSKELYSRTDHHMAAYNHHMMGHMMGYMMGHMMGHVMGHMMGHVMGHVMGHMMAT